MKQHSSFFPAPFLPQAGEAHDIPSWGQRVAVTGMQNSLTLVALALGRISSTTHSSPQSNYNNLPPSVKLLCTGEEGEGMVQSKAGNAGGSGKLWGWFSTLSRLLPVCKCVLLPMTTAVIQLGKRVNSNWLILTCCSVSERGYLINECQMLSSVVWIVLLLHGSVVSLKAEFRNGDIGFMLPSVMAMVNAGWIPHCHTES